MQNPAPGSPYPNPQLPYPPQPQMAAPGGSLVYPLHKGARTAMIVVGILLILLIVTIPFAVYVFVRTAGGRIEIGPDTLLFSNLMSKRWKLSSLRRLGVMSMPVIARGIGGYLAMKKVGGDKAVHLCAIDERGKKLTMLVSMFERYPEIIQQVQARTGLQLETLQPGAFGPKWPG